MDVLTLPDIERAAQIRLRPPVWDFLNGGAGEGATVAANTAAFTNWRLRPRVAVDVSAIDVTTKLLGGALAAPIAIAPTALHELCCVEAELATAAAAAEVGVPMVVSTFASCTIEEIATASKEATLWQQVYVFRDRSVTASLVRRAQVAGAAAIVVTVDSPWLGRRHHDMRRGGHVIPATVQARNLAASLGSLPDISSPAAHSVDTMDPALTWADISWLSELTDLPIVVKGVQTGQDACAAAEHGAAAVIVSNHGGRQLDGARSTLDALPEVVAAVGAQIPVLMDGGIRSGRDALIALALGARAVLLGRPVLHGLAVAGQDGARVVLSTVVDELVDAMGQCGRTNLAGVADGDLLCPASANTGLGRWTP